MDFGVGLNLIASLLPPSVIDLGFCASRGALHHSAIDARLSWGEVASRVVSLTKNVGHIYTHSASGTIAGSHLRIDIDIRFDTHPNTSC